MSVTCEMMSTYAPVAKLDTFTKAVKKIKQEVEFSNGITMTIVDFKPKYHLDDITYQRSKDIWTLLPRGRAFAVINDQIVSQIFANPKFGNEGDNYHQTVNPDKPSTYVMLEKSNGEAMHLAAFTYNNQDYLFGGSKLVHIVIRVGFEEEDFMRYPAERCKFAIKMLRSFLALPHIIKEKTIDYLIDSGETFVGEHIDLANQHMVLYDENTIQWFAINKERDMLTDGLLSHTPDKAVDIFTKLGLTPVPIIGTSNDEDLKHVYESACFKENSEGGVCYVIQDDRVVKMYKVKNIMYIMMRATRELLKKNATDEQFDKRFSTITEAFPIDIPDDITNNCKTLCKEFFHWYEHSERSFDQYASSWGEFMKYKQ